MVKARKYVHVTLFQGEPKRTDFKIVEEELPPIEDGEYLAQALFLSVDPYMKAWIHLGEEMRGSQVARVIESKNEKYPVGTHVFGDFGWRTYTVANPDNPKYTLFQSYALPDFGDLSPSLALGVLGMPGNTAYFGFLELCQPKKGETVVVSVAAGAVGMLVGQIAKIKECHVIGFAGSDAKCKYLKEIGFDHAFNYKTVNAEIALKEAAPNGIDCYFDNAGGDLSTIIMKQMNKFGRISICGAMSYYNTNSSKEPQMPIFQPLFLSKELRAEAFIVTRWNDRWLEGIKQNLQWIQEGKLKYAEHVTEGFDKMYDAFVGMLRGENTGKAVVKV